MTQQYDLVIVGGGPAGLTAGLYAARAGLSVVLLEAKGVGGELLNTDLIEDYPGFASITGAALVELLHEQVKRFDLEIRIEEVVQIRNEGEYRVVETVAGAEYRTLTVIVCPGGEPVKLGVEGEDELHGRGVSYCAVCDGAFFKGAKLAVIGGGDSAFQEALFLTRFASELTLIHRRDTYKAQAILQQRLFEIPTVKALPSTTVTRIGGENAVTFLELLQDGKPSRLEVEGVFIFIGFTPKGRYLFKEHVDHDDQGYLITDSNMRTSVPGVYAVGDCRAQLARQITTATGDATTAVIHAERYVTERKRNATTE